MFYKIAKEVEGSNRKRRQINSGSQCLVLGSGPG